MANNELLNQIGEIINIADVLMAESAASSNSPNQLNGSITLTLGYAESGEILSQRAELWGTPGIISVPALPAQATNNIDSAQALFYNRNGQNVVFAVRDTRSQSNAGNINPGETCVFATVGQARAICKNDGSVTLMTTDNNAANGNNITLSISPTGFYFKSPFGKITFDATGFHVANNSGARIDLMGTSDPTTGSSVVITGGTTTISSSMIMLGTPINTALPLPVVYGVIPVTSPGIPITGSGVGEVVMAAAASTSVFVGI